MFPVRTSFRNNIQKDGFFFVICNVGTFTRVSCEPILIII